MGTVFKLNPKAETKIDFKNGVGQVVATVIKTDDNRMVFKSIVKNYALNEKEQGQLLDFMLENM